MSHKPAANLIPAMYSWRIHDIQAIARAEGYAIAIHGSMQRDLDLVAIPWNENASDAPALVERLCERLDLAYDHERDPVLRPHRRLVWSLMMGGALFVDLSVMPRVRRKTHEQHNDSP